MANLVFTRVPPPEALSELLIGHEILEKTQDVSEGQIIRCLLPAWTLIHDALQRDPQLLYQFSQSPQKFEEFMATSYELDGFLVTLTPRSGDGGKDIIAEKKGFGAIRILDQCKAFSAGKKVGQDEVRSLLGVIGGYANASKAVLSTTSEFSPGIAKDPLIQQYLPYRLELRDGKDVMQWLSQVRDKSE